MILKLSTACGLALVGSLAAAQPGLAGPAGTGLPFTEETAWRRLQERTIEVALATPSCPSLTQALQQRPEVSRVKADGQTLRVTFRSERHATAQAAAVRSLAEASCPAVAAR